MTKPNASNDLRRAHLRQRVAHWSVRMEIRPRRVCIREMTRKWGSCSTSGIITLAIDLGDQDTNFQDFVIAHELIHLRVPNHGKLFKALLSAHIPDWRKYDTGRGRRG